MCCNLKNLKESDKIRETMNESERIRKTMKGSQRN